ncbi:DUF998 domain-containing protein [Cohnella silvisoli]|uniref:DUF998 domain-containing protein n=1 Tax=Cohnella silvisoli TaxID=2873699 RepID=A0ABV1KPG6_9BACL|nr:DUF998 domain-containing protein [Cohnella silvisoli]MCD9025591.1 DUF998 domain-containing protein [Cohnella silvisoli]
MPTSVLISKPVPPYAILAAKISIFSGALSVVLLLSLHLLEPEFDPTWRFISEYALGKFGWMMQLTFMLLAVCLITNGVALASQLRSVVGYIGLAVLFIGAIGLCIAAAYITDPISISQEEATFSGKMHVLGASLDYTPVAALLLSIALVRNEVWKMIRNRLFITAAITFILMIAFILFLPYDGKFGPGVYTGLVGRFQIISYQGWLLTVGFHILKLQKTIR